MFSDDHVIHVTQRSVFTSIDQWSPSIFMIQRGGMIDSGANCCITNSLKCLVDVIDIPPFAIGVAITGTDTVKSYCTKRGLLPLPLVDGSYYFQHVFYNPDATDTILSPQAIVDDSDGRFVTWSHNGSTSAYDGHIWFYSESGLDEMSIPLTKVNGLYFCETDTCVLDNTPDEVRTAHVNKISVGPTIHKLKHPTTKSRQLEAEIWAARLGFCGEWQLDTITANADGLPPKFRPHPLRFIDTK